MISDWIAVELDSIEWEFPIWDPPEGRFESTVKVYPKDLSNHFFQVTG
jgi:hypothetical protein